jgi:L-ascorbate metabolism protein UlaG (beta-lactamase superfamily)
VERAAGSGRRVTGPAGTAGSSPATEDVASLTFVGTATTVLQLGGIRLLTDPNFLHQGQRVYLGYGLFSRRRTEPALHPRDLPELDGVVLSHLHGDHFDRVARRELRRSLPVVTTPHAARRLSQWGFGASVALRTWESHELERGGDRVRITSVPGTHGPGVVGRLLPPVMGSVVELRRDGTTALRVYITGDTLFRRELHEVSERFPDLDVMVIHLGGTRALGILVTMDGEQGADMVGLIRPPVTIPVHFDDYTVFKSPLSDFLDQVRHRQLPGQVRTVTRGDTVALPLRPRNPS